MALAAAALDEFFAVSTDRQVYRVTAGHKEGVPLVQRITGDRAIFARGTLVGLTMSGVCLFKPDPKGFELAEEATSNWGDKTHWIGGLFLNEEVAFHCAGVPALSVLDKRFFAQTRRVVEAIDPKHPVFRVSRHFRARIKAA